MCSPHQALLSCKDLIRNLAAQVRTSAQTRGPRPVIFIPLYIYPFPGAWGPLFAAVSTHPEPNFTAIVNPNNGPGATPLPDANYLVALRELATFPNVTIVGYVNLSYGRRGEILIERDVERYRGWSDKDPSLRLDGIFFDEVPSALDQAPRITKLGDLVRTAWKTRGGEQRPRDAQEGERRLREDGMVVLNLGVVVSRELYSLADYVVAFEESHDQYLQEGQQHLLEQVPRRLRAKTVVMVHSCLGEGQVLAGLVSTLSISGFGGQFVTEQVGDGYTVWSPSWNKYVSLVSRA